MEHVGYGSADAARLDRTFAALAHPVRRALLARLAKGEVPVGELAAPFDMSQPAISRHLKVLEDAGLVLAGADAQRRPRRLDARPLAEAAEWLVQYRAFWEASFARLEELLGELQATPAAAPRPADPPADPPARRRRAARPAPRKR